MKIHIIFYAVIFVLFTSCASSPSPVLPPVALQALTNQLDIDLLWTQRFGNGVGDNYLKFQPTSYNNAIVYLDHTGKLFSLDKKTGNVNWQRDFNLPVSSQFLIFENKIVFGTSQGDLIMAQIDSGEIVWRKKFNSEILSKAAISDGYLVINTVDGYLYGLDVNTGNQRWFYNRTVPVLTLRGSSSPIITNGIVLSGFDNGKLIALTLNTGRVIWDTTIALPSGSTEIERIIDVNIIPIVKDDLVYIATYQGRLAAIELTSGKIVWSRELSIFNDIKVDAFRVYVTAADSRIWALDRKNGATLWKQDALVRRNVTGPVLFHDQLIVGDFNGYLHWMSRKDGKLLSRVQIGEAVVKNNPADDLNSYFDTHISKVGNILSVPIIFDNTLYATNRYGDVHAYSSD
ncbi:Outer membrane beta-barrel assembly protein BamB [hydrothermal vent metagenome]|uniref:Outer membrane beta-barrel assembly protein BamB n=1 Tax=hydrothermal vent metagenome TaxID=652676 RepID=A0A3B0ZUJ4_9ZZZZ